MPIAWTTNDGEEIEEQDTCRNKVVTGAGHKSEVAAPGDTGPAESRCEQIHKKGSEGHDLVPTAGWHESLCMT